MKQVALGAVAIAGTVATVVLGLGQVAQAGTLHNGWTYSIDSFNDGTEGRVIGSNSDFEFYGMAMRSTSNRVYFAFNSNLSLEGHQDHSARNGTIAYGDLFLNFSNSDSFNAANGHLYGIRFDANNDTGLGIGLYDNVTATSVTRFNSGYNKLNQHTNKVASYGGQASYGDLEANTSYFNGGQAAYTTIASGNFLGEISPIMDDFEGLGLDFAEFGAAGTHTFGFSVDQSLLPNESFIAHLFAECGNDGMVLQGDIEDVPEPSLLVGFGLVGAIAIGSRRKRTGSTSA